MKHKTSQKGFTLIELIAVMVILGILAAVLIPRMTSVTESAYKVNAKQMYSAIESHLYMQAQQAAITGGHGLEQFPTVPTGTINTYLDKWIADYDQEHWTQFRVATGGAVCDNNPVAAQDAIYFLYHPHEVWLTGAVTPTAADFSAGLSTLKDVYYITYYPLTNAEGKGDGIERNDFHLALHHDTDHGQDAENAADDKAIDTYHCGCDDKDSEWVVLATEVSDTGVPCTMHAAFAD